MNLNMTNKEYDKLVKRKSPSSPSIRNCISAFIVGGLICAIAQGINLFLVKCSISADESATLTSVTMIFLGALLTGLNVYDDIASVGGAGTLVPITGFANGIVSPAMEFKSEGYVLGLGAKMFTIAGPVIVFGTIASIIYGIIYYFLEMGVSL